MKGTQQTYKAIINSKFSANKTALAKIRHMAMLMLTLSLCTLGCKPETTPSAKTNLPFDTTAEHTSQRHRIQELAKQHNLTTERQWDSLNHFKVLHWNKKKHIPQPDYKVFGWHMYTNGSAYKNYDFSILSGIIYFSYEINPKNGQASNTHSWKKTAMVDSAKANNVKAYIAASNFGGTNNHTFLTNSDAQKKFIQNIFKLLQQRDADGVVIDFENVNGDDSGLYTKFIGKLSKSLKKANPKYECIICLYAIDYHKVFDIKSLNAYVNTYILMGYDYYGSFSAETGPVAPLHDFNQIKNYSLEYSVASYLSEGVDTNKLILGLPYYGAQWETQSQNTPTTVDKFNDSPAYYAIEDKVIQDKIKVGFDQKGISKYYNEQKNGGNYQTWFDDSTTLALKYDWAKFKDLGGVSPWIFSYSGDYINLWQLLADKFGLPENTLPPPQKEKKLTRAKTMSYFQNNQKLMREVTNNFTPWEHKTSATKHGNIKQNYQIYGFYPFWNDNKGLKIDFDLYSRIGYYAALPDPQSGKIKKSFNWAKLNTKLPHKHQGKVDLVVAMHNEKESTQLLKNSKATQKLIQELTKLLKQTEGDGITLDFGNLNKKDKANFAQFVGQLSKALKATNSNYLLNCMIPPVTSSKNEHFAYDGSQLAKTVDYFLLTGFDYNRNPKKYAGPNAPLYSSKIWAEHNVNASVLKYISLGVPAERLILVVPYFGKQSETESAKFPSKKKGAEKFISYSHFANQFEAQSKRLFDSASGTPCFVLKNGSKTYQTWVDDSVSLGLKYNYVKKNKLAGVGIWALGYDLGYQELTNTLIAHFDTAQTNTIQNSTTQFGITQFLQNLRNMEVKGEPLLWLIDALLLFAILVVLLLSLKCCTVRAFLKRYNYWLYGLGIVLFIGNYFLIRATKLTKDDGTFAITIFIVVACLLWIKQLRDSNARKNYP